MFLYSSIYYRNFTTVDGLDYPARTQIKGCAHCPIITRVSGMSKERFERKFRIGVVIAASTPMILTSFERHRITASRSLIPNNTHCAPVQPDYSDLSPPSRCISCSTTTPTSLHLEHINPRHTPPHHLTRNSPLMRARLFRILLTLTNLSSRPAAFHARPQPIHTSTPLKSMPSIPFLGALFGSSSSSSKNTMTSYPDQRTPDEWRAVLSPGNQPTTTFTPSPFHA